MAKRARRSRPLKHSDDHTHGDMDDLVTRNLPVLQRSMTFAKMIDLKSLSNLKDLGWLFPAKCHRKDQAALTDCERARYLCAFQMI